MPVTNAQFAAAAQKFLAEEEKAEKKAGKSSAGTALVAVPTKFDLTDMLAAFDEAAGTIVVKQLIWPTTIPTNHPLTRLPLHVRLWDSKQWKLFWDFSGVYNSIQMSDKPEDEVKAKAEYDTLRRIWIDRRTNLVVALSTCTPDGQPLFKTNPLPLDSAWIDAQRVGVTITDGLLPWIDLTDTMTSKYSGPAESRIMTALFNAGIVFNGLGGPEEAELGNLS